MKQPLFGASPFGLWVGGRMPPLLASLAAQNIQRHSDDLRSGGSGFNAAGLAVNGTGPGDSGWIQFRAGDGWSDGRKYWR